MRSKGSRVGSSHLGHTLPIVGHIFQKKTTSCQIKSVSFLGMNSSTMLKVIDSASFFILCK